MGSPAPPTAAAEALIADAGRSPSVELAQASGQLASAAAQPATGGVGPADTGVVAQVAMTDRYPTASGGFERPSREAPSGRPADSGRGPLPAGSRDRPTCTSPQLKRFIKSRVYVPMHELRRRFAIDGVDDDVTPVLVGGAHIYVGLPDRESRLLGELLRSGDVGYELSMDPPTPIVVGLYPMRPIPRS